MKLQISIEKPYFVNTSLAKACECLYYAVGCYNGGIANNICNLGNVYEGDNWKEYLLYHININNIDW